MGKKEETAGIPLNQRFILTPKEASRYFRIGEKKIRALAAAQTGASFVVYNGRHLLILREEMENFLRQTSSI